MATADTAPKGCEAQAFGRCTRVDAHSVAECANYSPEWSPERAQHDADVDAFVPTFARAYGKVRFAEVESTLGDPIRADRGN